jgi:hypothetical protein
MQLSLLDKSWSIQNSIVANPQCRTEEKKKQVANLNFIYESGPMMLLFTAKFQPK